MWAILTGEFFLGCGRRPSSYRPRRTVAGSTTSYQNRKERLALIRSFVIDTARNIQRIVADMEETRRRFNAIHLGFLSLLPFRSVAHASGPGWAAMAVVYKLLNPNTLPIIAIWSVKMRQSEDRLSQRKRVPRICAVLALRPLPVCFSVAPQFVAGAPAVAAACRFCHTDTCAPSRS